MSLAIVQAFDKAVTRHMIDELKTVAPKYPEIFNMVTTTDPYVDSQSWAGYGNLARRDKLGAFARSEISPSFTLRTVMNQYGLADFFPKEDIEDNLYGTIAQLMPATGGAFARAATNTMEAEAASWLISQFATVGTNWGTADNLSIFGTTQHAISASSNVTFSTGFTVPVDLSYAAMKYAEVAISTQPTSSGTAYTQNRIKKLLVHPNSKYEAMLVLNNEYEPDSANRNENNLKQMGIELIQWNYFNVSGSQGALNSAKNGWIALGEDHNLNFYLRSAPKVVTEDLLSNNAYSAYCMCRFALGAPDLRGLFGSPGL